MNNQRTVSSILKSARVKKSVTLEAASQALKIQIRFLKALEEGRYEIFSSPVHLKGFLKNYASFLELNVDEILAFFRREYPQVDKVVLRDPVKPLGSAAAVFTPERLIPMVGVLLILTFFTYLFIQYRAFASAPGLTVVQPKGDTRAVESVLNVSGRTDKDAVLSINGQTVSLSDTGEFSAAITLLDGVNVLGFISKNNLGRQSKVSRTVILERYPSQETAKESSPSASISGINLELNIGPGASWIEVRGSEGEEPVFRGLMVAGVSRKFFDPQFLKLRTGNAGSTSVIFNGRDGGKLGSEGEIVEKEFTR